MKDVRVANFLGVGVDAVTYEDLFAFVDERISDKRSRSAHVACINAYCATLASRDEDLGRIYNGADIVGPDGYPFVLWIRYVLRRRTDRIAAPDTLLALAEHSRKTGYTFFLYGGSPEVVVAMKDYLERRFPDIRIIGYLSPPFRPLTEQEDADICNQINRLAPDIICVGLGTPKQDYWIAEHLESIRGSVMLASGATFDFFGGRVRMAPGLIRRSGLEWLYRLMRDFRRLWRRYTLMNLEFVGKFALQVTRLSVRTPYRWQRPWLFEAAEAERASRRTDGSCGRL
jgi:N-acetylglucosaminyldiphosphoundecaprenol N-acetyl-beta-D-mannosaminyltransferase